MKERVGGNDLIAKKNIFEHKHCHNYYQKKVGPLADLQKLCAMHIMKKFYH